MHVVSISKDKLSGMRMPRKPESESLSERMAPEGDSDMESESPMAAKLAEVDDETLLAEIRKRGLKLPENEEKLDLESRESVEV